MFSIAILIGYVVLGAIVLIGAVPVVAALAGFVMSAVGSEAMREFITGRR